MILQDNEWPEKSGRDLTIEEAGELLNVDRTTISSYIRKGDLRAWIVNPSARRKTYRIPYEALDELRKRQVVIPPPPPERHRPRAKKKEYY